MLKIEFLNEQTYYEQRVVFCNFLRSRLTFNCRYGIIELSTYLSGNQDLNNNVDVYKPTISDLSDKKHLIQDCQCGL